jgi:hypothetical protein
MVIRLSQAMAQKLKVAAVPVEAPAANPFCEWVVRPYRCGRIQYVLATNTTSLFCINLSGKGLTSGAIFRARFSEALREHHQAADMSDIYDRYIVPHVQNLVFTKTDNSSQMRAVAGSMNEFVFYAQCFYEDHVPLQAIEPLDISNDLNGTMMSFITYQRPAEAHRRLVSGLPLPDAG